MTGSNIWCFCVADNRQGRGKGLALPVTMTSKLALIPKGGIAGPGACRAYPRISRGLPKSGMGADHFNACAQPPPAKQANDPGCAMLVQECWRSLSLVSPTAPAQCMSKRPDEPFWLDDMGSHP
jgi:hypothetical protein